MVTSVKYTRSFLRNVKLSMFMKIVINNISKVKKMRILWWKNLALKTFPSLSVCEPHCRNLEVTECQYYTGRYHI